MDKQQKQEKLEALINHIEEVQRLCKKLGWRLIDDGEFELGKRLIANCYLHDNSKFHSLEWMHLTKADDEDEMLEVAIDVHTSHNLHHPEYWGGIRNMPPVYLAELVCDWKARSSELGTDLREWIDEKATKRWKFSKREKIYKEIVKFVNLLVESIL